MELIIKFVYLMILKIAILYNNFITTDVTFKQYHL